MSQESPHAPHPYNPDDFKPEHAPALAFPDEDWQWFLEACRDFEIAVEEQHRVILQQLYSHLLHVNQWLNLTRITDPRGYLKFHVLDSLTVLPLVKMFTSPGDIVLDLGSGGGYPGLPLMTFLPDRHFVLVDSRPKKVAFLAETLRLTGCQDAQAMAFRGREVAHFAPQLHQACQLVTARAVGKIVDLLPDCHELLLPNGYFLCLKGQSYPTQEREHFLKTLPPTGFELLDEVPIALDEEDPDRWCIVTSKLENAGKRRKKPARRR